MDGDWEESTPLFFSPEQRAAARRECQSRAGTQFTRGHEKTAIEKSRNPVEPGRSPGVELGIGLVMDEAGIGARE